MSINQCNLAISKVDVLYNASLEIMLKNDVMLTSFKTMFGNYLDECKAEEAAFKNWWSNWLDDPKEVEFVENKITKHFLGADNHNFSEAVLNAFFMLGVYSRCINVPVRDFQRFSVVSVKVAEVEYFITAKAITTNLKAAINHIEWVRELETFNLYDADNRVTFNWYVDESGCGDPHFHFDMPVDIENEYEQFNNDLASTPIHTALRKIHTALLDHGKLTAFEYITGVIDNYSTVLALSILPIK
ncbi:hypothetical protein [Photobacterium leiognathi]|uniref:hypothetical protein n=1 Tax=Photobacterium leiognathi TaxID=553611 RepID=UPI0029825992|nr:hypothetical protein [Photobacterium leiognathi]